jgi:hypothetical protein
MTAMPSTGVLSNAPIVDRETFDLIKKKPGAYASWAVWAEPTGRPKSGIGDLRVLDPDQNPTLLQKLRNDVVMVALNLSSQHGRTGSSRNNVGCAGAVEAQVRAELHTGGRSL